MKSKERKAERIRGIKTCTGDCGNTYPNTLEFFNKNSQTADGLHYICRMCRADYSKKIRTPLSDIKYRGRLDRKKFLSYKNSAKGDIRGSHNYIAYIDLVKRITGSYPTLKEISKYFEIDKKELTKRLDQLRELDYEIRVKGVL